MRLSGGSSLPESGSVDLLGPTRCAVLHPAGITSHPTSFASSTLAILVHQLHQLRHHELSSGRSSSKTARACDDARLHALGSGLYNNGSIPNKVPRYGEFYSMRGVPCGAQTYPPPTEEELEHRGVIPFLEPLPLRDNSARQHPANLRAGRFEPNRKPASPIRRNRRAIPQGPSSVIAGWAPPNRTDPVFIGLQKILPLRSHAELHGHQ